jgi:hypothetical protein
MLDDGIRERHVKSGVAKRQTAGIGNDPLEARVADLGRFQIDDREAREAVEKRPVVLVAPDVNDAAALAEAKGVPEAAVPAAPEVAPDGVVQFGD